MRPEYLFIYASVQKPLFSQTFHLSIWRLTLTCIVIVIVIIIIIIIIIIKPEETTESLLQAYLDRQHSLDLRQKKEQRQQRVQIGHTPYHLYLTGV